MKRRLMVWLCACVMTSGFAAETALLENSDFSKLDAAGKPEKWEVRVPAPNQFAMVKEETGTIVNLKCADDKQAALLMYRGLPLETGKLYQLSYEVKGAEGAKYLGYCEWLLQSAGMEKPVLKGAGTVVRTATAEWVKQTVRFTFPADCTKPYLVLSCRGGEVSFRNLELKEMTTP